MFRGRLFKVGVRLPVTFFFFALFFVFMFFVFFFRSLLVLLPVTSLVSWPVPLFSKYLPTMTTYSATIFWSCTSYSPFSQWHLTQLVSSLNFIFNFETFKCIMCQLTDIFQLHYTEMLPFLAWQEITDAGASG